VNATLPKGTDPASLTLDDAVAMLAAKASGGGGAGGRMLGDHPDGGAVSVRAGRFGAYVNWGKVNATIPKSTSPEEITLDEALTLIAEREGKPAGKSAKAKGAKAAKPAKPAAKAPAKKAVAKTTKKPAAKSKAASTKTKQKA
ncbi:MAG: DNA topoisomerase I, partial [Hyphomicrobiales bacterium]|nr:DNA topoisomerase I [Hyphomicrobiales bacterium]MBV8663372.1 DNA topoisomerase I [Hyphomicrobiales bacterium]